MVVRSLYDLMLANEVLLFVTVYTPYFRFICTCANGIIFWHTCINRSVKWNRKCVGLCNNMTIISWYPGVNWCYPVTLVAMICRKQQLHAVVFVAVGREHSVPACCQGWASGQGAGAPQVQYRYKYVQLGKYMCEFSIRNDTEIKLWSTLI